MGRRIYKQSNEMIEGRDTTRSGGEPAVAGGGAAGAFCPRRVLYHHRTQGKGVEGVHIRGIVGALAKRGIGVDILGPPGTSTDETPSTPPAGTKGKPGFLKKALAWFADFAPECIFEATGLVYNALAFVRLYRATRSRRYDMIYERYALFLAAGVFVAKLRRIPIVVEVNDSAVVERNRPLAMKWLARRMERWVLRNATLVVTVSQPFKQYLMAHGLDGDRVVVTPNAVNPEHWPDEPLADTDAPAKAEPGPVTIGVVAAFVEWHRPDFLIRCAAEVMKQVPVRLLMVGDGPARPRAEALARELGCDDRVTFTGFVAHKEVPALLGEMDVAVMPHSNDCGSPMKIFEYMAAGKAVVAPAVKPIEEVVADGRTGLLFEPLDRTSLTNALLRLVKDRDLRHRLGRSARRHVLSNHTWAKNVERVLTSLPDTQAPNANGDEA